MAFTGKGSGGAFPDPVTSQDVSADAAHFRDEVAQLEKEQSRERHARWRQAVRRLFGSGRRSL